MRNTFRKTGLGLLATGLLAFGLLTGCNDGGSGSGGGSGRRVDFNLVQETGVQATRVLFIAGNLGSYEMVEHGTSVYSGTAQMLTGRVRGGNSTFQGRIQMLGSGIGFAEDALSGNLVRVNEITTGTITVPGGSLRVAYDIFAADPIGDRGPNSGNTNPGGNLLVHAPSASRVFTFPRNFVDFVNFSDGDVFAGTPTNPGFFDRGMLVNLDDMLLRVVNEAIINQPNLWNTTTLAPHASVPNTLRGPLSSGRAGLSLQNTMSPLEWSQLVREIELRVQGEVSEDGFTLVTSAHMPAFRTGHFNPFYTGMDAHDPALRRARDRADLVAPIFRLTDIIIPVVDNRPPGAGTGADNAVWVVDPSQFTITGRIEFGEGITAVNQIVFPAAMRRHSGTVNALDRAGVQQNRPNTVTNVGSGQNRRSGINFSALTTMPLFSSTDAASNRFMISSHGVSLSTDPIFAHISGSAIQFNAAGLAGTHTGNLITALSNVILDNAGLPILPAPEFIITVDGTPIPGNTLFNDNLIWGTLPTTAGLHTETFRIEIHVAPPATGWRRERVEFDNLLSGNFANVVRQIGPVQGIGLNSNRVLVLEMDLAFLIP